MKVCIIGRAKSGTTALYAALKAAMPADTVCMFEPKTPRHLRFLLAEAAGPPSRPALTKMMFTASESTRYDERQFDRTINIVRDPRDVFVSSFLFRFHRQAFANRTDLIPRLLELLERKERAPRDVTMLELLACIGPKEAAEQARSLRSDLAEFADHVLGCGSAFALKYDDLVAENYDAIDAYLGFSIKRPKQLTGWFNRIGRKGEVGDWLNWFTEEDVAYFRPAMQPFIETFGFDPSWALTDAPQIAPEHCSKYVRKLMDERPDDPHVNNPRNVSIEALEGAAADYVQLPLMRLGERLLAGEGVAVDRARGKELLRRAAGMGEHDAALKLAEALRADDELGAALPYYRQAAVEGGKCEGYYWLGRAEEDKQDYAASFAMYRLGALGGSLGSMRGLARAFTKGRGTTPDPTRSAYWQDRHDRADAARKARQRKQAEGGSVADAAPMAAAAAKPA